jgi:hypothetical protein
MKNAGADEKDRIFYICRPTPMAVVKQLVMDPVIRFQLLTSILSGSAAAKHC